MKFTLIVLSFLTFLAHANYSARFEGNQLFVSTPYGTRIYFDNDQISDFDHYSFAIPRDHFAPKSNDLSSPEFAAQLRRKGDDQSDLDKLPLDDLIVKANQMYNKAEFDQSLEIVDSILKRNGKYIRAWIMKGSLMHLKGESKLARKYWEKAMSLDPSNKNLKKILGEI